jgi:hypothetical protein
MSSTKSFPAPTRKSSTRIGDRLREHVEQVIVRYAARLRGDPLIPMAAELPSPLLEDHALSFLGDLFQTVVVLEKADDIDDREEADLLKDGTRIQHLISELHGHQRHRLGWTESALRREYAILAEEVESLARRLGADGEGAGDLDFALDVLRRLLARARDASFAAYSAANR